MSKKDISLKPCSPVTLEDTRFDNQTFDLHVSGMTEHFVPFNQCPVTTHGLCSEGNLLL